MRFLRLLPILFLIDSCVEPLAVDLPKGAGPIVFDGIITNDPGPYVVKLFYSGPFDGFSLQKTIPERKAIVRILSDAGENEQLIEVQPGIYQTSASGIRGQLGRSYSLQVRLASGKEYSTAPQKMAPAGQIDNLYVEFEENSIVPVNATDPHDSFSIYIDARGDQAESNLYRWRWANTFKGKTFPELHQIITVGGAIAAPLPCSGYVANPTAGALAIRYVGPCTCCICWGTEYNSKSIISDNRFSKDNDFPKVLLAKLPLTAIRFYEKYYIAVEQLSVSPEVYEFWKLAEALQESTGSLFQPNSVKVRGNIKCLTKPEEEVLGIFSVSAITRKNLFVDKSEVTIPLPPLDTIMYDCREILINGTTQKPPFW